MGIFTALIRNDAGNIPFLLVGNQNDLVESQRISYDEAKTLVQSLNMHYGESSAKSGDGAEAIFTFFTNLTIQEIS